MKKNFFEETYKGIEEAKRAYLAAETKDEKNAASALYQAARSKLVELSEVEAVLWRAYEISRDCGNEYLDLCDTNSGEDIEGLVASMRRLGFKDFTFSSTWGGAVETAWLFQKAGCTLAGLIEINSHHKAFRSEEYEKAHAYLFKLN